MRQTICQNLFWPKWEPESIDQKTEETQSQSKQWATGRKSPFWVKLENRWFDANLSIDIILSSLRLMPPFRVGCCWFWKTVSKAENDCFPRSGLALFPRNKCCWAWKTVIFRFWGKATSESSHFPREVWTSPGKVPRQGLDGITPSQCPISPCRPSWIEVNP